MNNAKRSRNDETRSLVELSEFGGNTDTEDHVARVRTGMGESAAEAEKDVEGKTMMNNVRAMDVLARKAANHNIFIGHVLRVVAEAKQTTVADVASSLGCAAKKLPRLVLCRIPREAEQEFAADIQQISEYVGCDAGQLAEIVREYQNMAAGR